MTVPLDWKLTWEGHTWTAADLTGEELAALGILLGDTWDALHATRSPVALMSHIAVHVGHVTGAGVDAVLPRIQTASVPDLLAAIVPQ